MADFPEVLNGDAYLVGDGLASQCFIGVYVTQKVGFYGTQPVVQAASANQADQGVMTTVGANTGTAAAGLSLIGDTSTVDQAANIMNDFTAIQEDIAALDTLLTEIRTALVNMGIIKGAA